MAQVLSLLASHKPYHAMQGWVCACAAWIGGDPEFWNEAICADHIKETLRPECLAEGQDHLQDGTPQGNPFHNTLDTCEHRIDAKLEGAGPDLIHLQSGNEQLNTPHALTALDIRILDIAACLSLGRAGWKVMS